MTHSRWTSRAFVAATALGWLALTSAPKIGAVGAVQPRESDTLQWLRDYGDALALSKQTGHPLLVEFRCAP